MQHTNIAFVRLQLRRLKMRTMRERKDDEAWMLPAGPFFQCGSARQAPTLPARRDYHDGRQFTTQEAWVADNNPLGDTFERPTRPCQLLFDDCPGRQLSFPGRFPSHLCRLFEIGSPDPTSDKDL